jgi:uncharacterized protein YbaR (Trm112 family)
LEEIIRCPVCRSEYSLLYDSESQVVSQTPCKCKNTKLNKKKPLDEALEKLEEFRRSNK